MAGLATLGIVAACGAARSEEGTLSLELNKLEPQGQGCRAYVVALNKGPSAYQTLKLDLILFQTDGVIGRRFAVDLAPLKPGKRTVKLFDMENAACDQVGSFLINEVMECKLDSGPVDDCLANITTSSLAKAQLSK